MAGFEVRAQTFGTSPRPKKSPLSLTLLSAVVTQISSNLLTAPVSGLMGLGFSTIASSGATPFWEALANSDGTLDQPLMAFQLTRFVDDAQAQQLEPGGTFNLGSTNSSLFTGSIDYQSIPSGQEGYWIQELTGMPERIHGVLLSPNLMMMVTLRRAFGQRQLRQPHVWLGVVRRHRHGHDPRRGPDVRHLCALRTDPRQHSSHGRERWLLHIPYVRSAASVAARPLLTPPDLPLSIFSFRSFFFFFSPLPLFRFPRVA